MSHSICDCDSNMSQNEADLRAAYLSTDYQAWTPYGPISIRVGQPSLELDRVLGKLGFNDWAFITAHNPGSRPLEERENQQRHEALLAEVAQRGWVYFSGRGVGDDACWPPEESLLILGVGRAEAVALGSQFGQNAIVCGQRDQPAQLVWCSFTPK